MDSKVHMHHMQKSIILSLARTSPLRFSQLQPPRTANNIFSYHLKKLVKSGYVELTPKGYVPTRKALKMVVFGANITKPQALPGTVVSIYVEDEAGHVLLISRNHQPFQGWYGLPGGLVRRGETLEQAARRELEEKTTLTPKGRLSAAGALDFRYIKEDSQDIFLHNIAFIYVYKYRGNSDELSDKMTRFGQLSWSKLDGPNVLPEVYVIKKLIGRGKFGLSSVSFEEPSLPMLSTT